MLPYTPTLLKTGLSPLIPVPTALSGTVPGTNVSALGTGDDKPKMDWLSTGIDGVRALTAAVGAAQPLPTRPVNPELLKISRLLADKQNEGLGAADRVNLLRQKAATQAYDVQSIRDSIGGGGSAAAVLGALNNADNRANALGAEIEQQDRAQRAQNQANYYADLQNTQNASDSLYAQQYNTALQNKNAFTQATLANLQNITDRNQYEKSYGKGSPAYDLMLKMAKRTQSQQAYADSPVTSLPR